MDSIKIGYWIERLDEATKQCVKAFGRLTPEELNWKPTPEQWCVGQCIDHIIKTNETYFPIFRSMLTGSYQATFIQKIPFLPDFFGNMLLKSIENSNNKQKTFPVFEPSSAIISSDIVKDFINHQDQLKTLVENTQHLNHNGLILSSPANKYITYSLASALDIIVAHEFRHLAQAKRVAALEQIKNAA
ncbi:MAG: DinB family protein [Flammeovirgaceae bacterium]